MNRSGELNRQMNLDVPGTFKSRQSCENDKVGDQLVKRIELDGTAFAAQSIMLSGQLPWKGTLEEELRPLRLFGVLHEAVDSTADRKARGGQNHLTPEMKPVSSLCTRKASGSMNLSTKCWT